MEKEWRCKPELSGGGELIDQGSHLIDLSRWFLGDLELAFAATPTLFWDMPVDDNCFLALKNGAGKMAWLHASWTEWKNMFSFEISGRDGKLDDRRPRRQLWRRTPDLLSRCCRKWGRRKRPYGIIPAPTSAGTPSSPTLRTPSPRRGGPAAISTTR